jgi:hypothetical protein
MKKDFKNSLSTTLVVGGVLFASSLQATGLYDPGAVAAMPQDTMNFVNRLNSAGAQASYLSSLPNSSRGMRNLETYYRNRHEHFLQVLANNIRLLNQGYDVISKASRTGGPDGRGLSDCLSNNKGLSNSEQKSWDELKNSFLKLDRLRQYAETSVSTGFPGMERPMLGQDVLNAYNKVGAALDLSEMSGSFWEPINSCCARIGPERSQYEVCSEDYIKNKLSILDGIQKLPSNFVDPMNPGLYAQTLTPEDIVNLMSLGQMQDFIHAKDFNAQVMALQNADMRCVNAREDAIAALNKRGERQSLIQTAIPALQCSLGNILRNSSKTVRQIGFGLVNAKIPVYNTVSECSEETKQAAATTLFYSPEAFRADFEHLVALPTNMLQSQPMAKPIEVYERDGLLTLDLRDEAGFTREMLYITDEVNPQYAQMQATAAGQAVGQTPLQVVNNGTIVPDGTTQSGRVVGRSVVNGVGASRSNGERVLVRSLASRAAEGDLESARTLAGAVRGRKNELEKNITQASSEKSLISNRKVERATSARGLVTRSVIQEAASSTTKAYGRQLATLRQAIGLSGDTGRVVERPGGNTGDTSSTGGSTVTSNLPAYADRAANAAYKEQQSRKAIAEIRSRIRQMGNNIVEVAAKVNQLTVQKVELAQRIAMMADATTFKKIGDAGFDDRADVIMRRQDEIVRLKKEFYALNAQELGAKAVLATAKSSMLSYIEGAKAFQGLDVRQGSIAARSPASINPAMTQQQQTNFFQMPQMPNVPGGSNLPPNMNPPMFNPTPTQNPSGYSSVFPKWMELFTLPMAHAAPVSVAQKRKQLLKEFDAFLKSYNAYSQRIESEVVVLKQQSWERFILNEREMRKEPLLSSQERMVLGAFNDTLREEIPDLVKAKVSGALAAGTNPQLYKYIDQIRSDAAELNELLIKEATLANEVMPKNILQDDEVWTGLLPAIALD